MSLRSIFLTLLVMCAGWYWLRARELKDHCLKAAAKYCDDLSLKLLDDSVVLSQWRPVRTQKGGFLIKRRYQFDFTSNGDDRYQGEILIIGHRVEHIKLEPHRID